MFLKSPQTCSSSHLPHPEGVPDPRPEWHWSQWEVMSLRALCPSTVDSGTAEALGEPDGVRRSACLLWGSEWASALPFCLLHHERTSRGMTSDSQGQASRPCCHRQRFPAVWDAAGCPLKKELEGATCAAREHPSGLGGGDEAWLC